MNMLKTILVFSIMFTLLCGVSATVGVYGIDLEIGQSSIYAGDEFDLTITFNDPYETSSNQKVFVEIKVDGVLVHEKEYRLNFEENVDLELNISSSDFELEDGGDVWNKNLMNYACKEDIEVEVMITNGLDSDESANVEFDIRPKNKNYELFYEIDPEVVSLDEKFTVNVWDEDDKDVSQAYVKFTWIDDDDGDEDGEWDVEDDYTDGKTGSKGYVDFKKMSSEIKSDAYGLYQLDIYKQGYCKITKQFAIRNALNISDPDPIEPIVGESFRVNVTTPAGRAATGLTVYMNPGGVRATVSSSGVASFVAEASGTYTLAVGGSATGYDESLKTITVSKRDSLIPSVSTDPAAINSPISFTVKSGGEPVAGATVSIMRAGGIEQTLAGVTSSSGVITFTPTIAGDYTVKATKTDYDSGTDTFSVQNGFNVLLPTTEQLKPGMQASIMVSDLSGAPVAGASVTIEGAALSGITDSTGKYFFTMVKPGNYKVIVTKLGFTTYEKYLESKGLLTVKLSMESITLGQEIKITSTDRNGMPIHSNLRISGPAGVKNEFADEYMYKTEAVGDYTVEAVLESYDTGKATFKVTAKPLDLSYSFSGGKLIINASSMGEPVAGITILVKGGDISQPVTTNDAGLVEYDAGGTKEFTLISDSRDYLKTEVNAVDSGLIPDGIGGYIFPVLIVLFALVILVIIAVIVYSLMKGRGKGAKESFRRQGSRLDR